MYLSLYFQSVLHAFKDLTNFIKYGRSGGLLRDQEEVLKLQKILVNLKELRVSHNSYLSDALLNRLLSIAPNLQSLSLEGCQVSPTSICFLISCFVYTCSNTLFVWFLSIHGFQISFHMGLYKKFYPRHTSSEMLNLEDRADSELKIMESSSILTFKNILYHITSKAEQLHTLCFSQTLIDSPALTELGKVNPHISII